MLEAALGRVAGQYSKGRRVMLLGLFTSAFQVGSRVT